MFKTAICLLLASALFISGCSVSQKVEEDAAAINIVTTIYPLADILKNLGGDRVSVSYLLPAGASPHTFEPTVEQVKQISKADLFVFVGSGLDDWALKLTGAAEPGLDILELSPHVELIASAVYHQPVPCDAECPDHDHGPMDPHFWLDPVIVRDQVSPLLAEALAALDHGYAASYTQNLSSYQEQLSKLHEDFSSASAAFTKRSFIAFHSAWGYLARRYGLQEVAVIAEFPGQEPSAGWMAALVELARKHQLEVIFAEPQFSPALAEKIAAEIGARVLILDPLGGEEIPGRDSYLALMRYNLNVFQKALR